MLRALVYFVRALPAGIAAALWLQVLKAPFAQSMLAGNGSTVVLPGGFIVTPTLTFLGAYLLVWALILGAGLCLVIIPALREG